MELFILSPNDWSPDKAAIAYSFCANIAILLGYTQKTKEFTQQISEHLFKNTPQKNSFEYKMLESLGRLPNTYHLSEIVKFSDKQKQQIKIWYSHLLTLEPLTETHFFLTNELLTINNIISKFK